jgi:bla regulator protein BlaR1
VQEFFTGEDSLFAWLWRSSWQAAVLIGLVLLVQWLFRKQLSPAWRYNLWLLVLIRLVMPSLPGSAVSVFNLAKFSRPLVANKAPVSPALLSEVAGPRAESPTSEPALSPRDLQASNSPAASGFQVGLGPTAVHHATSPMPRSAREIFLTQCRWLWVLGAIFFFFRIVCQNVRFATRLKRRSRLCNRETLELLDHCKREVNIRQELVLLETPLIGSPSLYGLLHPKLLLPEGMTGTFTAPELRYVFLHELAHMKRRDMAVHWLMTALQGLHWFNPIIWVGFSRMRADRELACDALALSCAKEEENRPYGETIIKLLAGLAQPASLPGLIGILETRNQMRHRMSAIAHFKKDKEWPPLACLILAGLGVTTLTDARTSELHHNRPSLAQAAPDHLETADGARSQTPFITSDTNQPIKVKVTAIDAETKQPIKITILRLMEMRATNLVYISTSFTNPEPGGIDGQFNLSIEPSVTEYSIQVGAPDYEVQGIFCKPSTNRNPALQFLLKKKTQSLGQQTPRL